MQATKIILENERPVSWNTMYSGRHWSWRSKEKNRVKRLVRHSLGQEASPYDVPVDIEIVVYFKNRPMDSDNICDKFYIDAIKDVLIHEDDRRFVRRVTTLSEVDKVRPRMEITVKPYERNNEST